MQPSSSVKVSNKSTNPKQSSDSLHEDGGLDVRIAKQVWCKLAESEARLHLMMELMDLKIGFPDVEEFCLELESRYKATATENLREKGESSLEWKVVKACMDLKVIDERKLNASLVSARYNMRKTIKETLMKNSRRARNLVKKLRQEAARSKVTLMKKHEGKLKHLRRKYRTSEEAGIDKIPDSIKDLNLENLSIFDKEKFDAKPIVEYETEVIGELELTNNERLILKLPPNFAIEENLPTEGMAMDEELAYAKARITLKKEQDEKLEDDDEGIGEEPTEEEEEQQEKLEAQTRQIYNPTTRTFDDRRRRVTDLKECSRVTLPRQLNIENEALIEMRRGTNGQIYEKYRKEECNQKGEVKGNLTEDEKDGLKSLQRRMKSQEIIILKTDKSGKLCVTNREEYLRMGKDHTEKDIEVDRKQVIEIEKQLNGHVFFWSKVWGSGDDHGHRGRIIDSKIVSSEQLASMYLMYKDHKIGRKTRPVVTGCNSNTRGFSNCVSDLLESVNKANETPYEAISTEDTLAKVEEYNKKAAEIMEEGREKLMKKIMCSKTDGVKKLACCDKLWKRKRTQLQERIEEREKARDEMEEPGTRTVGGAEVPTVGDLVPGTDEGTNVEDCRQEDNEEILKFRHHQYRENPEMRITSEDIQLVMECDHCGPDVTECVLAKCEDCGDSWVREDYVMCIVGNDVISLFPSLDSVNTGKIVRHEVTNSTIKVEGFDMRLGLRYVAMNEGYTSDLEQIRNIMPKRVTKPGIKPTMKSKWVNCKEILEDDDWVYPTGMYTEGQRRIVMGHVAEIGTRVVFENFCYRFGGVAYQQQAGGPIGARVTMCAARMVMQHWSRGYLKILLTAGLRVPLMTGYVDDGRQGSTVLRKGMIFNEEKSEFVMDEEQYAIDVRDNEDDNVRMARVCLPAMNSVNPNLRFTTEAPEDFPRKRLPTLDFVIWMVDGILYHSYFEKKMKNQYTILSRNAMSEHQKISILSNELVRRLSNIHRDVLEEEIEEVTEHFITQLKNSGYHRKQAKEIIVCGLVGWRRKLERRDNAGQEQYLHASQTLEKRTDDKLLEKANWYKENKKRQQEDMDSKFKLEQPRKRKRGNGNKKKQAPGGKTSVKSVLFVPYTKHSELASRLRENEEKMEAMTGYRLKVVEKVGTKIVDILHKADPWAGEDCGRRRCLMCMTKKEEGKQNTQDCKKRNCVYQTSCMNCTRRQDMEVEEKFANQGKRKIEEEKRKIKRYIYIGESNRSPYERGLEHQDDITYCKTSSHMLRHLLEAHEEEEEDWDKVKFSMKVIKYSRTAFDRQIQESVEIQRARKHRIMNVKSEYNRCAIPRLTAKLGERELDKWREEDREEQRKEATIEEKIRIRRKERAKMRAEIDRRRESPTS